MPKLKIEDAESLSRYERQKLQRLYTQGAAAYCSVHNLAKTSRLPVSKVRQFLHSKASYTKFTLAARKFKRMRAFARFRNETWCMDLAYVDKLAREKNGVKYLLVRHDLFDRTVNAKWMKTEDSQETVKAFSSMITKRNRPKNIYVDKGTELAGAFKKFCTAERIQIYSTMSGCFCWTYNTIIEKYSLPLHGRLWVQVYTQTTSIYHYLNFYKKQLDRYETRYRKEFRLYVYSLQ